MYQRFEYKQHKQHGHRQLTSLIITLLDHHWNQVRSYSSNSTQMCLSAFPQFWQIIIIIITWKPEDKSQYNLESSSEKSWIINQLTLIAIFIVGGPHHHHHHHHHHHQHRACSAAVKCDTCTMIMCIVPLCIWSKWKLFSAPLLCIGFPSQM